MKRVVLSIGNSKTIGTQVWTTTNLNVASFHNGEAIPEAQSDIEWKKAGEEGTPAWCYYGGNPANGSNYGKLYNWFAVNDSRGIIPQGWHIPTYIDWDKLTDYLGGGKKAGNKIKSLPGWKGNDNGDNCSGFSANPGGSRYLNGEFHYLGQYAYFWASSEKSNSKAWFRFLFYNYSEVLRDSAHKGCGLSVRCVKD